jgi:hypothetical protein
VGLKRPVPERGAGRSSPRRFSPLVGTRLEPKRSPLSVDVAGSCSKGLGRSGGTELGLEREPLPLGILEESPKRDGTVVEIGAVVEAGAAVEASAFSERLSPG